MPVSAGLRPVPEFDGVKGAIRVRAEARYACRSSDRIFTSSRRSHRKQAYDVGSFRRFPRDAA